MSEKLKPCPFCGGTPKLKSFRVAEDAEVAFICCSDCEAKTTEFEDAYAPFEDAITAWNTRKEPTQ